jgi:glutathione peroxidase
MKDQSMHSIQFQTLEGKGASFADWNGKVVLVVNVASECGYTPQYEGLEKLWKEKGSSGLVVVGFPSNEFGGQEPGSATDIRTFCTQRFGVTFPLAAKCETKSGPNQSPVYKQLGGATGSLPGWNFCKYLVGKDGKVIGFWNSKVTPDSPELRAAIDKALSA